MTDSQPSSGEIVVNVFGLTDVGRTREHNEDCFTVADLTTGNATLQPEVRSHKPGERGSLFMVADGMGGAAAGEIASAMAVEVVLAELDRLWRNAPSATADTFIRAIKSATEASNARIHKYAAEHPQNRGMGTTATIAGFLGETLYLAQVGDSRGYLVRRGQAIQITKDQSLMQKLIDAGELSAEEAEVSERRNIILQALGPEPIVKVDITTQEVRRGDTLILCSDGMSGQMRANDIARIVGEDTDLVATCRKLIDLANENGGPDNITVIAARFDGDGLSQADGAERPSHKVYKSESDARATVPVSAASIPDFELDPIVAEVDAVTVSVPAVTTTPAKRASGGAAGAQTPAAPAGERRIPVSVLRIIFGSIAVLLSLYWILVIATDK